ncbi:hypothetical protein HNO88_002799 [Novosphingobium chloroacetimidivorans]|uniref:DUF2163 domain-containing protein n=1 Tax=Novosphingobium chloroacetimidivorans TaxID=1428314 RepID=A0A7W7KBD5_9SPHN|nr:hypothetical protein [Novosphingobium chloroacetimidivorans]MBB4859470.1 hypothetical protein [Novosphingobium chloroacetimidivorans]
MDAALLSRLTNSPVIRIFHAVRIELQSTGTSINLIDGSASLALLVDGQQVTFKGSDPTFGVIGGIDQINEQIASEAPSVSVSLMPASANAIGELSQPDNQGSPVRIWMGSVDDLTGIVIGMELLWSGRLDTVVTSIQANGQSCELVTVSAYDRLFSVNEGEALNSKWHQAIWPGETGFDFNVDSTVEIYWGGEAGKPSTTPIPGGGGSIRSLPGIFGG